MKRDGAKISLWQNEIADYSGKTTTVPTDVFDVVIVGGGMTGITTALLLQKSGKKCLVAEAHTLCFGTTGGTTAHLNTFFDTPYNTIKKDFGIEDAQTVARAARQALDLVKENVTTYNIDCGWEEKSGFVYAQNEDQEKELQQMLEASLEAGVSVAFSGAIPVPVPFTKAIVFTGQAQFHPTKYVLALAKAFEEAGGVILQNCAVTAVTDEEPLVIETSLGHLKSSKLIYATHIPPGINLLHFRNAPYRSYAMAVTLKDGNYPTDLTYDMYDPYHYYRMQEVDGKKYLIAGGEDHKTGHEPNTEKCFLNLEAYLRTYFDIDEVAFKWSSEYFEPSDGLAYIGHLPGSSENIYVATGYGGNGMTYSHIAARALHDLLVRGQSELADLYDPARIKMVAGFAAFVKENADVVKEFFGKRLSQEKISTLAELAPGDATVVKYEGESVAIYKDDAGKLFAVNPVCTHAKYIVAWNRAEKSWDCPCHGARYDVAGNVLTGPARKALEVVSLEDLVA
ncbi:MAG TPA: FAD-dependent oxidoreductase [Chitinophagaceae bacterium]|nr:FAD-dependent oxidoreductase [Chitinophagaceae bacterium]